ncbi:MAG: DUF1573 domain-containing protein [Planctomycetota bacterium]
MKTLLGCLICACAGTALAYGLNHSRHGIYEPVFGPIDVGGEVTAANAMEELAKGWNSNMPEVVTPQGRAYDFGVASPGDKGEHTFVVRNVGEADLSLEVGASTCKCTVGSLETDTLAPGESTEVKLAWTVKTNAEKFGQSAELITNDPKNIAVRFEISGQVVRKVQLVPDAVTFGEVAAGESIAFDYKIFSYIPAGVTVGEVQFSDDQLNDLAEFDVKPFEPGLDDGVHSTAKQGFQVFAKLKPGLNQGPISQNLNVSFDPIIAEESDVDDDEADDDVIDSQFWVPVAVTGRIVGAISMLPNGRLMGVSGGGYIYDFGKVGADDALSSRSFVVLKGEQREKTQLSVGEVSPEEELTAELGEPIGRGTMKMYPLILTLKPGTERRERLGRDREDYAVIPIESDNPKVPTLKLRVKYSVEPR